MDFLTFILIISIIHCCLYFFDVFFKSCSHYPYLKFLEGTGLHISFFKVTWFTTACNRPLQKWGSFRSKALQQWFNLGIICSVILIPVSLIILIHSTVKVWSTKSVEDKIISQSPTVEYMIPGVNLPLSDIGYYLITLTVCSVIHEFGHAVAAVREDVHVSGVGLIIVFVLPIAYVQLNSDQLSSLQLKRQLRIYCAGIWHNVILVVLTYFFFIMIPILFYPVYDIGRGVFVRNIHENSPILGPRGLSVNEKVVAINDCEVSDTETWKQCLINALHQPAPGYCVTQDLVHQLDESIPVKHLEGGVVQCCNEKVDTHLCFETLEDDKPLQILQYSCLPARPVIAGASYTCRGPIDCPPGLHCLRPALGNGTTLLRIQRYQGSINKNVVIFLGHPLQVLHTVETSDFVPIFSFLPSELPDGIIRLSKYFIVFSSGLALVNVVPCFFFDGNHITYSLLLFFLQRNKRLKSLHQGIRLCCNILGTCLLVLNFLSIVVKLIYH